ncbi:MAG: ribonuclease HII [Spirochaetales bacterium]|nr:ribonuclease HII [Spirochaetales bacterium]
MTCGVDEAGRGPLAGPVTAGAVVLGEGFPIGILADSKALSPMRRERAAAVIRARAKAWAAGWAWPEEIDRYNIHCATLLAMARAVRALGLKPDLVLVDGLYTPAVASACRAMVGGDTIVPEIMAASIVAKTARDLWMERYGRVESDYRFEEHKGYPTKAHRELVKKLGPSPIHRKSFRIS